MGYGIRADLRHRFKVANERDELVLPTSGSDKRRLDRACRRGDLVSPARRVYALPEYWNKYGPIEQARRTIRALARLHPSWVFCHTSAAVIYRLEVGYGQLGMIHVASAPESHTRSIDAIQRHVIRGDEFAWVDGVPVTSFDRTVFDCVRMSRFPRALAIADSALRESGKSADEFLSAFRALHKGHRNWERAIQILPYANPLAENGGESVARATMIKLGYEVPQLQVEIPNPVDPTKKYRVDFFWELPTGSVVGELDGHDKYVDPGMTDGKSTLEVMTDERLRESRISGSNLKVLRFSYKDVSNYAKFSHLLDCYGIPNGRPVPAIAWP